MTTTTCPRCGRLLPSDEERQGRCSACLHRLPSAVQTELPSPARVPAWADDRPDLLPAGRRRSSRSGAGWTAVRIGLSCLAAASLVLLLVLLGGLFMGFLGRGSPAAVILLGLLEMLAGLLGLVGLGLCCAAPAGLGLRPLALGCLACQLVAAGLVVAAVALDAGLGLDQQAEVATLGLVGCSSVLVLAGGLLLCLYLRSVALHFGSRPLASESVVCYGVTVLFALLGVVVVGWTVGLGPQGGWVNAFIPLTLLACGAVVFVLVQLLWLFSLFVRLHDLIPPAAPWHEPEDVEIVHE